MPFILPGSYKKEDFIIDYNRHVLAFIFQIANKTLGLLGNIRLDEWSYSVMAKTYFLLTG